jgi:opine dehydrogenase
MSIKKKVTVLGYGGTAHVAAANLTLQGHETTLAFLEKYGKENLDAIREKGGILLRGNGPTGFASPHLVTTDLKAAVEPAEIILVSVIANYHEELAEAIAPHVESGQVILIAPGNGGALTFYRAFKRKNVTELPLIAEGAGNFTSARITGPAEVIASAGLRDKKTAAFPAVNTQEVIKALEGVIKAEPLRNVFETTLNSPNLINHLVASVLNASKLDDRGEEFKLFIEGQTPVVKRGYEVTYREWKKVLDALGYAQLQAPPSEGGPTDPVILNLRGPESLRHRYVSEDAGAANTLLVSIAELLGIDVPFSKALITLVSQINDVDYYGTGKNLEYLGLSGKTIDEINEILENGFPDE